MNATARSLILGAWIIAAIMTPSVRAAETSVLRAETAQADNSTPSHNQITQTATAEKQTATPAPQTSTPVAQKPLQGGVSKLDELLKATESTDLYKLSVKKLSDGVKLSAEEYRSLGVGCLGFESDRTFFQNIAIVSDVYSGSPADLAGIHVGDKLIEHDNDEAAREHPEIPRWKVSFGQAGTQKQIVVLRHHRPITLTLTRMNIEDIIDDQAREEWEQIIAKYGYLNAYEFEGVGQDPLASKSLEDSESEADTETKMTNITTTTDRNEGDTKYEAVETNLKSKGK